MWELEWQTQRGHSFKEVKNMMVHGPPIFWKLLFLHWELHRLAEVAFTMRVQPPQFLLMLSIQGTLSAIGLVML